MSLLLINAEKKSWFLQIFIEISVIILMTYQLVFANSGEGH